MLRLCFDRQSKSERISHGTAKASEGEEIMISVKVRNYLNLNYTYIFL